MSMPSANDYFDGLVSVTERLILVLDKETDSIRSRQIVDLSAIHHEKSRLSFEYEQKVRHLAAHPTLMNDATPAQKEALQAVGKKFEIAARHNLKTLKAAHDTGARVLDAIRKAAAQVQEQQLAEGYGKAKPRAGGTLSVSVDQTL